LPIAGWIANHVEKDFSVAEKNIHTINHFLSDFPFIGTVSHHSNLNEESSLKHINKQVLINTLKIKK